MIEKSAVNSGLLMNRIVYQYFENGSNITDTIRKLLNDLEKNYAENKNTSYNSIFADLKMELGGLDEKAMKSIQPKIDILYSVMPKKMIDGLNLEYQFKMIAASDTLYKSDIIIENCIKKIRSLYNFNDLSWQNALKLAYVFKRYKDYKFAANLLEPFLDNHDVEEQLLFNYISLCAQVGEKINSNLFAAAMR